MTDEQFLEIRKLLRALNLSMATQVALLTVLIGDKPMSADVSAKLEELLERFEKSDDIQESRA